MPWRTYGRRVSVAKILDLLLLTASLSAVVKRFRFGFSHETARKAAGMSVVDVAGGIGVGLRVTQGLHELRLARMGE